VRRQIYLSLGHLFDQWIGLVLASSNVSTTNHVSKLLSTVFSKIILHDTSMCIININWDVYWWKYLKSSANCSVTSLVYLFSTFFVFLLNGLSNFKLFILTDQTKILRYVTNVLYDWFKICLIALMRHSAIILGWRTTMPNTIDACYFAWDSYSRDLNIDFAYCQAYK